MSKGVMAILLGITLFACESNSKNVQKLNLSDSAPVAVGKNINLKYTDSGKVVANLMAPKVWDYTNFRFSYREFPDGVEVRFWDEEGQMSVVTSDFAVHYERTGIIDLRENVVFTRFDSLKLNAEQLYWDQNNAWVFTDQPYRIVLQDGSYNDGARFDSSEDFTNFLSRDNSGIQIIDKNETTNDDGE